MPFDGLMPLQTTVALIDGVLDLYGPDGTSWTKYSMNNRKGQHCLVGAIRIVRRQRGIRGDQIRRVLRTVERRATGEAFDLEYFNDIQVGFEDIRTILLAAREIVMAKIEGRPEQPVDISSISHAPEQRQFALNRLVEDLVARQIWARR